MELEDLEAMQLWGLLVLVIFIPHLAHLEWAGLDYPALSLEGQLTVLQQYLEVLIQAKQLVGLLQEGVGAVVSWTLLDMIQHQYLVVQEVEGMASEMQVVH